MARALKPWAYGPFEILLHAETHYRSGQDMDRRIAMIGFDNAVEVAITTYLNLNPVQRGNRSYAVADVERWLRNFHTKAEFFFIECGLRNVAAISQHDEIVWFHDLRNGQYHNGGAAIPQRRELDGVRAAALEIFSVLFEVPDVDVHLEEHLAEMAPPPPPPRIDAHDRLIDDKHGLIEVCGQLEYVSDVLYALDPERYRETALEIEQDENAEDDEAAP